MSTLRVLAYPSQAKMVVRPSLIKSKSFIHVGPIEELVEVKVNDSTAGFAKLQSSREDQLAPTMPTDCGPKLPIDRKCQICGITVYRYKNNSSVLMAHFPSSSQVCKKWVKVIGRKVLALLPMHKLHFKYVCVNHFVATDFDDLGYLYHDAVPSRKLSRPPLSDDLLEKFPVRECGLRSLKQRKRGTKGTQANKDFKTSRSRRLLKRPQPNKLRSISDEHASKSMKFKKTTETATEAPNENSENPSPEVEPVEGVCVICLHADRSLRPTEETLTAFYYDMSHHKGSSTSLNCCSECETTLKKCYNFKRKCIEARRLLTVWTQCSEEERPPKDYLHEELGPRTLNVWSRKNIGMYYYNNSNVTTVNEKFEFNITKSESGDIESMIMVTNTNPRITDDINSAAMTTDPIEAETSDAESVACLSDDATITDLSDDESVIMNANDIGVTSPVKLTKDNTDNFVGTISPVYKLTMNRNLDSGVGTKSAVKLTMNKNNVENPVKLTIKKNEDSFVKSNPLVKLTKNKMLDSFAKINSPVKLTMDKNIDSIMKSNPLVKLTKNTVLDNIVKNNSTVKMTINKKIVKKDTNSPAKLTMNKDIDSSVDTNPLIKLLMNKNKDKIMDTNSPAKLTIKNNLNSPMTTNAVAKLTKNNISSTVKTISPAKLTVKNTNSTITNATVKLISGASVLNSKMLLSDKGSSTNQNNTVTTEDASTEDGHDDVKKNKVIRLNDHVKFTILKNTDDYTNKKPSIKFEPDPTTSKMNKTPVPVTVFDYVSKLAEMVKDERNYEKTVSDKSGNDLKKNYINVDKKVDDMVSKETNKTAEDASETTEMEPEDKQIVTYESLRENNVIVKEVVKIKPDKREPNKNKYSHFKLKTLAEIAEVDIQDQTADTKEVTDLNEITEDNTDVREDSEAENDGIEDNEEGIEKNEDGNNSDGTECSADRDLNTLSEKNKRRVSIKIKLEKTLKRCSKPPVTADGYKINKYLILWLFKKMADDDVWDMDKFFVGSYGGEVPPDLVNYLAELQKKYLSQYAAIFEFLHFETDEEILREFETRKNNPLFAKSDFKCLLCLTGFRRDKELINHMKLHTPMFGDFECDICHVRRKTKNKLSVHKFTHQIIFKCKMCPKVTNRKAIMARHTRQHQGHEYVCEVCGCIMKTINAYHKHKRYHRKHFCGYCGDNFASEYKLNTHKKSAHAGMDVQQCKEQTYCDQCKVVFASRAVYQKHCESTHDDVVFPRFRFNEEDNDRKRPYVKRKKQLDQSFDLDQTHNASYQTLATDENVLNTAVKSITQTMDQTDDMVYQADDVVYQADDIAYDTEDIVYQTDDSVYETVDIVDQTDDILDQAQFVNQFANYIEHKNLKRSRKLPQDHRRKRVKTSKRQDFTSYLDQALDQHNKNELDQTEEVVYQTDDNVYETVEVTDESSKILDQTPVDESYQDDISFIAKRVKKSLRARDEFAYSRRKSSEKRSLKYQRDDRRKRVATNARKLCEKLRYLDQHTINDMPNLSD